MKHNPQVGDIWRYDDLEIFYLLILEKHTTEEAVYLCLDLERGERHNWSFDKDYHPYWEFLA